MLFIKSLSINNIFMCALFFFVYLLHFIGHLREPWKFSLFMILFISVTKQIISENMLVRMSIT